jgi:hypothetical protein
MSHPVGARHASPVLIVILSAFASLSVNSAKDLRHSEEFKLS